MVSPSTTAPEQLWHTYAQLRESSPAQVEHFSARGGLTVAVSREGTDIYSHHLDLYFQTETHNKPLMLRITARHSVGF